MTEPIPRAHADLIKQCADDSSLQVWEYYPSSELWMIRPLAALTQYGSDRAQFAVGHKPPTEPPPKPVKMCELGGLQYPMPMQEAPELNTVYWFPGLGMSGFDYYSWVGDDVDKALLAAGVCQLTAQGAEQQIAAIKAAIAQSVAQAK